MAVPSGEHKGKPPALTECPDSLLPFLYQSHVLFDEVSRLIETMGGAVLIADAGQDSMIQLGYNDLIKSWHTSQNTPDLPKPKMRQILEWSGRFGTVLDARNAVWVHRGDEAPPDVEQILSNRKAASGKKPKAQLPAAAPQDMGHAPPLQMKGGSDKKGGKGKGKAPIGFPNAQGAAPPAKGTAP